jgi:predicted  nucleic acid-binding Zn-ribbon protein
MLTPALEKLLVFQDRDQRRLALEAQVRHVPEEIATVRRKIEEERASIEAAKAGWREVETRRKTVETEIGAVEQKINRFKSQQLEVRKNDEYQALGHEIEAAQAQVQVLEEEEIKVLYGIDEAKDRVKAVEGEAARSIGLHEERIRLLEAKGAELQQELATVQTELATTRAAVPEAAMAIYQRLVRITSLPLCVPLREHKCTGCHLKVSSGVESEARGGVKFVCCDNCGRIVFWES